MSTSPVLSGEFLASSVCQRLTTLPSNVLAALFPSADVPSSMNGCAFTTQVFYRRMCVAGVENHGNIYFLAMKCTVACACGYVCVCVC